MRYFSVIYIALALLLTSCYETTDSGYDTSGLRGDKYVGTLTVTSEQEGTAFYAEVSNDMVDILMPGVSFMPGLMPNLDMALVDIPLLSSTGGVDTYYLAESQMVTIYDGQPLLNDIIQSITEVEVLVSEGHLEVRFTCGISTTAMGDLNVPITYEGDK